LIEKLNWATKRNRGVNLFLGGDAYMPGHDGGFVRVRTKDGPILDTKYSIHRYFDNFEKYRYFRKISHFRYVFDTAHV